MNTSQSVGQNVFVHIFAQVQKLAILLDIHDDQQKERDSLAEEQEKERQEEKARLDAEADEAREEREEAERMAGDKAEEEQKARDASKNV